MLMLLLNLYSHILPELGTMQRPSAAQIVLILFWFAFSGSKWINHTVSLHRMLTLDFNPHF